MRVVLVGSDCEENLGLSMIAASLLQAGHQVRVLPFNELGELEAVADRVLQAKPRMIGLGMQFQHRSSDFLLLAQKLRARGYQGHITCGGQYPSMAWQEVLEHHPEIDSVVLHEGEASIVELCTALNGSGDLHGIAGLAVRDPEGSPRRTAARPLCADLDQLPTAHRYREPAYHLGLAFRPVWGSRGCWGSCAFCSITTYYREAHNYAGGRKVRLRSVQNLAEEMAALWHAEGDTTLFCFHDETLLLPRPADSIARLTELRRHLDALGVGDIGMIGKCRPDCVTEELAKVLRQLGVIRMFVGVENGSQTGLDHLGRRTTLEQIERALAAYESAGIFVCYNLLIFEPDTQLDDLRANIEFMRKHAHIPVNFCRAEPYHGTPLYHRVKERGTLMGSHLGWDYRLHDNRAELAFRISAAVFRERNFDAEGVANRTMGLGYTTQLLKTYYDVDTVRGRSLLDRIARVTRDITEDTARFLEQVIDIAESADLADHDSITRRTAQLGLQVSAHNALSHAALDDIVSEICAYVEEHPRHRPVIAMPDKARAILERMTLAGCFAATLQACGGSTSDDHGYTTGGATSKGGSGLEVAGSSQTSLTSGGRSSTTGGSRAAGGMVYDMVPPTGGKTGSTIATGGRSYVDALPMSGGRVSTGGTRWGEGGADSVPSSGGRYNTTGGRTVTLDTLPYSGGKVGSGGTGSLGAGGMVYDMAPPSGGRAGSGGMISDPTVPTGGNRSVGGASWSSSGTRSATGGGFVVDCVVNMSGVGCSPNSAGEAAQTCIVDPAPPDCNRSAAVVENWRDSGPQRLIRSTDVALYDPPNVKLEATRERGRIRVCLKSDIQELSLRWQTEGIVEGTGLDVMWNPANEDDALSVAARSPGGLAIAMLRACEVPESSG